MFDSMSAQQASLLHFIHAPNCALQAVVACCAAPPALLLCRFQRVASTEQAVSWALRLAALRAEQAKLLQLPINAAQAIVLRSAHLTERAELFEALGCALNDARGAWIALADAGTSYVDMRCMAQSSAFVCVPESEQCAEQVSALGLSGLVTRSLELALGASFYRPARVALLGLDSRLYRLAVQLSASEIELEVYGAAPSDAALLADECNALVQPLEALSSCSADALVLGSGGVTLSQALANSLRIRVFMDASECFATDEQVLHNLQRRGVLCVPAALATAADLLYGALHWQGQSYPQICKAALGLADLLSSQIPAAQGAEG